MLDDPLDSGDRLIGNSSPQSRPGCSCPEQWQQLVPDDPSHPAIQTQRRGRRGEDEIVVKWHLVEIGREPKTPFSGARQRT